MIKNKNEWFRSIDPLHLLNKWRDAWIVTGTAQGQGYWSFCVQLCVARPDVTRLQNLARGDLSSNDQRCQPVVRESKNIDAGVAVAPTLITSM
jgi:hypothetical protein